MRLGDVTLTDATLIDKLVRVMLTSPKKKYWVRMKIHRPLGNGFQEVIYQKDALKSK